jgi:hypothetical protein
VENVVEVRYAGVGIGRSTVLRDWSAAGAFIGFAEPMPTGTPLVLIGEGIEQAARVAEVIESANLAVAGMRVEFAPERAAEVVAPAVVAVATAPSVEAAPSVVDEAVPAPAPAAPGVASPEPVEPPSAAATVAPTDVSGAASPPHPNEGEAGSSAGSGKRRRRRR